MGFKFRFDKQFDYRPTDRPMHSRRYLADKKPQTVNEDCAKKAVAAGVGELISEPERKADKKKKD